MKLYIIRHGETSWNKQKKLQGQRDIMLNDAGIRLAELMRFERLAADKIAGDVSVRRKTLRTGNGRNNKGVDGKRDRVPVRSLPSLRNDGSETWEGTERPVCIRILSCRASYSFVRM